MRRFLFPLAVLAFAIPISTAEAGKPATHVYGSTVQVAGFNFGTVYHTFDVTADSLRGTTGFFEEHDVFPFEPYPDVTIRGEVHCLVVTDPPGIDPNNPSRFAYMSGTVTESTLPRLVGTSFYTTMSDSGSPDGTGDTMNPMRPMAPDPLCLSVNWFPFPPSPLTSGNVVIDECDHMTGSGKCKTKHEKVGDN